MSLCSCQPKIPISLDEVDQRCEGRAHIELQHDGEDRRATTALVYSERSGDAHLDWIFYNPLGMRMGRLILSTFSESFWQDSSGRTNLEDYEGKWLTWVGPTWVQDIRHLVGLEPTPTIQGLSCETNSLPETRVCQFESQDLSLKIDFTFLSCLEGLD